MFASKYLKPLARVLDVLFSSLIVAPLVVVYWFTTWMIFDVFIFPENEVTSALASFAIGFCGQFIVVFYQDFLTKYLTFEKLKLVNVIVTKLYALVIAITSISLWRGTWKFCDMTTPDDNFSIAINIVQNVLIMTFSKTFRNSIAALFVVTLDHSENVFLVPTYFKRVKADGCFRFFADCFCTCCVMALTVVVWRDIWTLVHLNLLPEDALLSGCVSLAIGYVLAFVGFALEDIIGNLYRKSGKFKFLFFDVFILLCVLATVFVWRGIWSLLDNFIQNRIEIAFILNGVSWKLLMILNCTNSLTGKGIWIDCEEDEFALPYHYFRTFHQANNESKAKVAVEGKVNDSFETTETNM